MAIHPVLSSATQQGSHEPAGVDVEAWTEEAIQAMGDVTLSAAAASPRPSVTLEIPLDSHEPPGAAPGETAKAQAAGSTYVHRRDPIRRDSLKRREALLKGKEGSRRRQRWENDRLLSNPYMEPPLPGDWQVRPTYPVRIVPYYLAPLWDEKYAARSQRRASKGGQARKGEEDGAAKIPKELREKLKRARAAKGLLQELEEEVRRFVEKWHEQEHARAQEDLPDPDSEDDEIVFVGRNGQMHDRPSSRETIPPEKLVFDSLVDDHGGSFGRWLVHSIAAYYGLRTWSITAGNPARRKAYVGIKETKLKSGRKVPVKKPLPRPLWGMV